MSKRLGGIKVVVFTLKTVPISAQYLLTSVLVQLTRTPSVLPKKGYQVHIMKNRREIKGPRKVNTHALKIEKIK